MLAKQDNVIVFGGGSDIAKAFKKKHKGNVCLISHDECDVTTYDDVANVIENYTGVLAVVNCAGTCHRGEIVMSSWLDLKKDIDVNITGAMNITRIVCKAFPYARIVHISSMAGLKVKPGMAIYSATKAAIISMVKSVAAEGYNIYAIAPTIVNTKMTAKVIYNKVGIWQPEDVAKEIVNCVNGKYRRGKIVKMEKRT